MSKGFTYYHISFTVSILGESGRFDVLSTEDSGGATPVHAWVGPLRERSIAVAAPGWSGPLLDVEGGGSASEIGSKNTAHASTVMRPSGTGPPGAGGRASRERKEEGSGLGRTPYSSPGMPVSVIERRSRYSSSSSSVSRPISVTTSRTLFRSSAAFLATSLALS